MKIKKLIWLFLAANLFIFSSCKKEAPEIKKTGEINNKIAATKYYYPLMDKWANGSIIKIRFLESDIYHTQHFYVEAAKMWETYANIHFEFISDAAENHCIILSTKDHDFQFLVGQSCKDLPLHIDSLLLTYGSLDYKKMKVSSLKTFGRILGFDYNNYPPAPDLTPTDKDFFPISLKNFIRNEYPFVNGNKNTLVANEKLTKGQNLISKDGRFQLIFQTDGNVVLYKADSPSLGLYKALWSTKTNGQTVTDLLMQYDGNLVLYNNTTPVWSSNTQGHAEATLLLQDDGNLVIYDNNNPLNNQHGEALWSTGTVNDN